MKVKRSRSPDFAIKNACQIKRSTITQSYAFLLHETFPLRLRREETRNTVQCYFIALDFLVLVPSLIASPWESTHQQTTVMVFNFSRSLLTGRFSICNIMNPEQKQQELHLQILKANSQQNLKLKPRPGCHQLQT